MRLSTRSDRWLPSAAEDPGSVVINRRRDPAISPDRAALVLLLCLILLPTPANARGAEIAFEAFLAETGPRVPLAASANDCWDEAPTDAEVLCLGLPEHANLRFHIDLTTGPPDTDVVIEFETFDITATAGEDYEAQEGSFVIPTGQLQSQGVNFIVLEDDLIEQDELFGMEFVGTTPESFETVNTHVVIAILDNDRVTISVEDGEAPEGGTLRLNLTLSEPVSWDVDVLAESSDGTATAGSDYPVVRSRGAILAGNSTTTGVITLPDDRLDEPDETFTVTLSDPFGVALGDATGTMTIRDNDEASEAIVLSASPAAVAEGAGATTMTLTAALDGSARTTATTVRVMVSGSGAADAVDFAPVADFEVEIGSGDPSGVATFILEPDDDAVDEVDETLTLAGMSDLPVTGTSVTLVDDDAASTTIALGATPSRVSEGSGATSVSMSATLDGSARTTATTVRVMVSGSGAADAVDFAPVADFEVEIGSGDPSGVATFILEPDDDAVDEVDETLTLAGMSDLPVTATTLVLADDDARSMGIALTAEPSWMSEDVGETPVTVTATLDASVRTVPSSVQVTVSGSGEADAVDFASVADFEILIAAGAAGGSGTFTVDPEDDEVDETDETLTVSGSSTLPVTSATVVLADDDPAPRQVFRVLLFESAANPARQGFLRVINHSPRSGLVRIDAVDDAGVGRDPVTLALEPREAAHFNSDDLENGNTEKGLSGGVGASTRGEWRLQLSSDLDIEVLAYARTHDGFVTTMHDAVPVDGGEHGVLFFNPGRNLNQESLLRMVNTGAGDVEATIAGVDDAGAASGKVRVEIPAGTALTLTAAELESGIAEGLVEGALGKGTGKWRLTVSTALPLAVKSLLTSPPGYLANLSTSPRTPGSTVGTHGVPLFPAMSSPSWQGVVRVVNRSPEAGEVRIAAMDDSVHEYAPVTLALEAGSAAHFNSTDLEVGNPAKGLTGSTGAGVGTWRLDLTSDLDIDVLSYVRSFDGFLTAMHDVVPKVEDVYRVVFFNPASNRNQVSRLRLINEGATEASVTVNGVDDAGQVPGSAVRLRVAAGTALEVSSVALESGEGEGIESGALGDGHGKWRLRVESDQPLQVMSLLESPTGHLTDLSTAPSEAGLP